MWVAVDGGVIVQPGPAKANVESAIIYGLSSVLHERVSMKDGAVEQSNFHDYPVMRMSDLPEQMNVQFVDVDTRPTGLGEIGNPFIAGAISNAVSYASPNAKALEFVDEDLKTDTSVYPSATVKQRLFADKTLSPEIDRAFTRSFTRVKAGK